MIEADMQMYGFYSKRAAESLGGVALYESLDSKEPVEITAVSTMAYAEDYKWPDKECRGRVGKYIRQISPSIFLHIKMSRRMPGFSFFI